MAEEAIGADSYDYAAFISYRHVSPDRGWAIWLQSALESYRPTARRLRHRNLPNRSLRIFRDEEEFSATSDLSHAIDAALCRSEFLIVVCSPRTPQSRWVNEEVARFRKLGRHDKILALLIEGEPREAFPPSLCEIRAPILPDDISAAEIEPLAADVRSSRVESRRFRKRMAKLRLLAPILGCRFDDLRQRDQERLTRRLTYIGSILAGLLIVISGLAAAAFIARNEAVRQRATAEKNFKMAQDAVDRYFTQVSEDRRLAAHDLEPLRRDLLSSASQFYERFVAEDSHQPGLRYDAAWARFRIASITEEIASPAEAVKNYEQAANAFREVAKTTKGASLATREGVLMCEINLFNLYDRLGQRDQSQKALAEALSNARSLVNDFSHSAPANNLLAHCLGMEGHLATQQGNLAQALKSYGDEIRAREDLVKAQPKNETYRVELAGAYGNLAIVHERYEHLDAARELVAKSLSIDRQLARENPDDGFLQHTLARTLTHAGGLEAHGGRGDSARKAYQEAVDLRIALVERHPDVLEYRATLANTADNFGVFCFDRGELELAQKYYQPAIVQADRLASDYPKHPEYQAMFANVLVNVGSFWVTKHRPDLAEQLFNRAYAIREKLSIAAPNDPERNQELASVSLALAVIETETKRPQAAEKHVRSAIEAFRRLVAEHPERPFYGGRLGACYKQFADLLKSQSRNEEALAAYSEARQLQRRLVADHPEVRKHRIDLAATCVNLGNLLGVLGQTRAAISAFDEIIQLFPQSPGATFDLGTQSLLEKAYTGRALGRQIQGDLDSMAADFEKAIPLATPERARILRLVCASDLAAAGKLDRATSVAEPLVPDSHLDGSAAFDLAVIYLRAAQAKEPTSTPANARAAVAERNIEQALKLLARALEAGYFTNPGHRTTLKQSPFVPLLATNAAYRKLLEAVEKQPAKKPQ